MTDERALEMVALLREYMEAYDESPEIRIGEVISDIENSIA